MFIDSFLIIRLLKTEAEGKKVQGGDEIIEMHAGFPFGKTKEEPVDDKLNTNNVTFIDSEVERRFKESHGQDHPSALKLKVKQFLTNKIKLVRSAFTSSMPK